MRHQLAGLGFDSPAHGGKGVWGRTYVAHPGLPVSAGGCARERGMLSVCGCSCFCRKACLQQSLREMGSHGIAGKVALALWIPRKQVGQS